MKGLSQRKYEELRKTVYFSFSLPSLGFSLGTLRWASNYSFVCSLLKQFCCRYSRFVHLNFIYICPLVTDERVFVSFLLENESSDSDDTFFSVLYMRDKLTGYLELA